MLSTRVSHPGGPKQWVERGSWGIEPLAMNRLGPSSPTSTGVVHLCALPVEGGVAPIPDIPVGINIAQSVAVGVRIGHSGPFDIPE